MTSASSRSDPPAAAPDASGPAPSGPDWAAIRQAYENRECGVRALCRLHGIHSQTLYRKAGKEGWPLRRESPGDAEERKTMQLVARLRRIAEGQIDEFEARRAARTELSSPSEPERDARALTALAKLIEHIGAIEAKHRTRRDANRDGTGAGSEAHRARRRAELADKLIAMLEQEHGAPLPEGDAG